METTCFPTQIAGIRPKNSSIQLLFLTRHRTYARFFILAAHQHHVSGRVKAFTLCVFIMRGSWHLQPIICPWHYRRATMIHCMLRNEPSEDVLADTSELMCFSNVHRSLVSFFCLREVLLLKNGGSVIIFSWSWEAQTTGLAGTLSQ